jgi:hypothetical protein
MVKILCFVDVLLGGTDIELCLIIVPWKLRRFIFNGLIEPTDAEQPPVIVICVCLIFVTTQVISIISLKNWISQMIATGHNGVELKFIFIIVSGIIVIRLL